MYMIFILSVHIFVIESVCVSLNICKSPLFYVTFNIACNSFCTNASPYIHHDNAAGGPNFFLQNGEIYSYQVSCQVSFQTLMIIKLEESEDDQLLLFPSPM